MHAHECTCLLDGAAAIDDLLEFALGMNVLKVVDPLSDKGFLSLVSQLERDLGRIAGPIEAKHVDAAVKVLNVNWGKLSDDELKAVARAANKALEGIPAKVAPRVADAFSSSGRSVLADTRAAMPRHHKLNFRTALDETDARVIARAGADQALFVTDQYAVRRADFSAKAREVVKESLELGLRNADITSLLVDLVDTAGSLNRGRNYWRVIASTFTARSRTFGQLTSLRDAEISHYIFKAVLDERTTNICRMMDGRVFATERGLELYDEVDNGQPEDVRDVMPWVRQRKIRSGTHEGKTEMFIAANGRERRVGIVETSGVGRKDDAGAFSRTMTASALDRAGLIMPPIHALCRSTIVPDL